VTADPFVELQAVAGDVSRETFVKLQKFEAQFLKWNKAINLVAESTVSALWTRHILDSAQLIKIEGSARKWVDVGSGGGFPGLVVAFLIQDRGGEIDLIESNRKKAAFLQAMVGQFGLPARVNASRIEDCHSRIRQPQVVTARALAGLPALIGLTEPWLAGGAKGLFHKGRDYMLEVEESTHRWVFDLVEHRSVVDPGGVILELSDVRPLADVNSRLGT
jgi:16S rRNA (guanine527-N7)-methyltransferase